MTKTKHNPKHTTKVWKVKGLDKTYSIWDFGDELTVHDGPGLLDTVIARVPQETARKMTDGHRRQHMEDAAGAIHVAKLLGSDSPNFHLLWRSA